MAQADTLLAMPESDVSANPNTASPRLKSDYFLAESKFQEEAFHESQQLFQKLIDSAQKNPSIKGNATDVSSLKTMPNLFLEHTSDCRNCRPKTIPFIIKGIQVPR